MSVVDYFLLAGRKGQTAGLADTLKVDCLQAPFGSGLHMSGAKLHDDKLLEARACTHV